MREFNLRLTNHASRITNRADIMNTQIAFRRAQVYNFLAHAFLYPRDNWTEEVELVEHILAEIERDWGLEIGSLKFDVWDGSTLRLRSGQASLTTSLKFLQAEHRSVFGLTGSQFYETEIGSQHEYRQSQEMADLAGFYRAFGFNVGGAVRERPDHLSVELEFMYVLALKESYAAREGNPDYFEISLDAQKKFLSEHLGKWAELFAKSLAHFAETGPYVALANFAAEWIKADARRLGVTLESRALNEIALTPFHPAESCEGCAVAQTSEVLHGV